MLLIKDNIPARCIFKNRRLHLFRCDCTFQCVNIQNPIRPYVRKTGILKFSDEQWLLTVRICSKCLFIPEVFHWYFQKCSDNGSIQLASADTVHFLHRSLSRQRLAVGAVCRHRIICICHGQNTASHGQALLGDTVRIPAPVQPLMMVADHFADIPELDKAFQHVTRKFRMQLNGMELAVTQAARLIDNVQRNLDLSQIMQQGSKGNVENFRFRHAQLFRNSGGVSTYIFGVQRRVGILCLNQTDKGTNRLLHVFLVLCAHQPLLCAA